MAYPDMRKAVKEVNERRKNDPIYDLRYRLFFAMRNDLGVMAEHNDSERSLYKELANADIDILNEYKAIFL